MAVGSTQRRHVRQAHRIVVETMTVTPRKGWLAKPAREGIAHHARPSPIAVCEGMDRHQAMMEANGDLVCRIRVELDPGAGIREGSPKLGIDLPPVAADILVRAAIGPSPIRLFVSKMSLIIGLFLSEMHLPIRFLVSHHDEGLPGSYPSKSGHQFPDRDISHRFHRKISKTVPVGKFIMTAKLAISSETSARLSSVVISLKIEITRDELRAV